MTPAVSDHVDPRPKPGGEGAVGEAREKAPVLAVRDLTVRFAPRRRMGRKGHVTVAADHVNLLVGRQEIVGLVGESGSGKSTIARCVCGLQRPDAGTITLFAQPLGLPRSREQCQDLQMVFQDPYASLDPRLTVRKTLAELVRYHHVVPRGAIAQYCRDLMRMVQLPASLLDALPADMSGGQRQRVAIAKAISLKPRLLIADEAVAALDVSVQAGIINLLLSLRRDLDLSILFISHDLNIVRSLCDFVYVIHTGKIVESGDAEELFSHPEDAYTKRLLSAIPHLSSAFLDRGAPRAHSSYGAPREARAADAGSSDAAHAGAPTSGAPSAPSRSARSAGAASAR